MKFEFDGDGTWEASSEINDEGSSFTWRIQICDDGEFVVSTSDSELVAGIPKLPCFITFKSAVEWCNAEEQKYLESMRTS